MPITQEERKTIIPTLIIGIGGTGLEVIMRVRRLVTESYGNLQAFPILGFLHIDTDQNAKPDNPLMAGPPLETFEIYRSQVSLQEAQKIVNDPAGYDWYHEWLPPELIANPKLLVSQEGAGQIRDCGRFSFFYNYQKIGTACVEAKRKIRLGDRVAFMSENYGLKVIPRLNVFVVGSIAGGTGSGMLIDLGYSLRRWFEGEPGLETTAIISSPDVFGSVDATSRVKENGYAALMELNYFSDNHTTFSVRYGAAEGTRIDSDQPPYDYIYIVGTSNEQGVNLKLDDVREMIAQNIFLDLVSDFSAYKRSIRDNIKRQAAGQNDAPPKGRSYPRNFMSFGLATIEIPIHHIRNCLMARLATDLCQWWQNNEAPLPAEPQTAIDADLRSMKLMGNELRGTILRAKERSYPYQAVVQEWLSGMRQEIIGENKLECTAQGINFFAKEKGKIVNFIDEYLRPKIDEYRFDHLRDDSTDERTHGDFLRVMYDNRDRLVKDATAALQEKMYVYLTDRSKGPKFLQLMLDLMEQSFESNIQRFEREAERTWLVVEQAAFKEYEAAISRINEFRQRWGLTKQTQINKECDAALENLGKALQSFLERKSRVIGITVLRRMKEIIAQLRSQLNRWQLRVSQSQEKFRDRASQEANQADSLEIVGIKLFEREELNDLYTDFLARIVNNQEGGITSATARGLEILCQQMTEQVLSLSSKFWIESREARATFRLLDIEKIVEVQYADFEQIVYQTAYNRIIQAPPSTKLYSDMEACTRFMRMFPSNQDARIQMLFEQSKPLVRLDTGIPQNSRFSYISLAKAGLLGGNSPTEPATVKQAEILRKYFTAEQAIAPLTNRERHKILAVHEVGGFSLRCIEGTEQMRRSYQDWRGRRVSAERARLRGQQADLPPSVHIQKDMVFWDFIPPDPKIEELVAIARALGILREEINQNTHKPVIRYTKFVAGEEEKVTLAANWEDAVQVLQLPDCGNDKREIKRQLDELIDRTDTVQKKQQMRQQMEAYLTQRLGDFKKKGGEDSPLYLRERDIIREFIRENQLGISIGSPSTDTTQNVKALGVDSDSYNDAAPNRPVSPEALYEQYLTQLSRIGMPSDALQLAGEAKARELKLNQAVAESILKKFMGEI